MTRLPRALPSYARTPGGNPAGTHLIIENRRRIVLPKEIDRAILPPSIVPSLRRSSGDSCASAAVCPCGRVDDVLRLRFRSAYQSRWPRPPFFGWVSPLALPSHRERSHCRARVPAPLGGPELGQLRDIPPRVGARRQYPRSVPTDVCNSRFRFQSWATLRLGSLRNASHASRDIRFHAGVSLRRARLRLRAFLPAASVGAYL